ncbi:MAG TPA: SDR family oxidoreductase [Longimicrobium sp.]|nr:SDR family oxidoreductase [Longimicrobium sp.]
MRRPELWAGVECTRNRVGDRWFDQLERSGHAERIDDLDRFAALGIRTIRYPFLWERIAPDGPERADWSWADARMERLGALGMAPVAGLVHHGSGPPSAPLGSGRFAEGLAAFAGAFARRYPHVRDYTPVNEPLTTARFTGLYGLWHPHGRDEATFIRLLLEQLRAVVLSMRAIREVNPDARLVQTEDLGKTHATRSLAYQARFENERRWLTWDLLCGRVDADHPLWPDLLSWGADERELAFFRENPTPPDVVGINHYLTSERFLDTRVRRYPPHQRGGNAFQRYADVEAVRVLRGGVAGPRALLEEAWRRYGLPLAVTEVHLGCTREEQLRWLAEVWDAADGLAARGVDVRAVTVWALLGSFDWDSLLTRQTGRYEAGAFDLRAPAPRPTALAAMARRLATGVGEPHPVLDTPGWWHRPERLHYPPCGRTVPPRDPVRDPRVLLITGATGTLGRAFARVCAARGIAHRLLSREEMDIADPRSVAAMLDGIRPWAVVNTAGYVRVDEAEAEPDRCLRENADGAAVLAMECAARGLPLVTFSSDLVFDGRKGAPYVESDPVAPLNTYGRSKAEAEARVMDAHSAALVVRTSAFFGPWDAHNFVTVARREMAAGRPFIAADDATVSPTYVPDLANACLDLLIDGERGIWHLATPGAITWAELARRTAELAGVDARTLQPRPTRQFGFPAPRPLYTALASERGWPLPPLDDALGRFVREWQDTAAGAETRRRGRRRVAALAR